MLFDILASILTPFWGGMRVLLIAQYGPLAASSRTRVFQYLPYLEAAGIKTEIKVVIPDQLVTRFGHRGAASRLLYYVVSFLRTVWVGWRCIGLIPSFDRVLIQKILFPRPIVYLLRKYRAKIVYDFDDAIFTTEESRSLLGRIGSWRRGNGLPRMLACSETVIVENEYTASYARQFCDRVETITGPIDTDRFSPRDKPVRDVVVLGWIGSTTTTAYLAGILESIERVVKARPNVSLRLVGALPFETDQIVVEQFDWSIESEVDYLAGFDIGLMPLPDDLWTRGKGGYKLLQYGAMGLPVVASPVGVNSQIVEDGVTGFLVDSEEAWMERILCLVDDAGLRARMGQAGRERMVEQYSLARGGRKFVRILCENLKNHRPAHL